jgi:hypothetical protein
MNPKHTYSFYQKKKQMWLSLVALVRSRAQPLKAECPAGVDRWALAHVLYSPVSHRGHMVGDRSYWRLDSYVVAS